MRRFLRSICTVLWIFMALGPASARTIYVDQLNTEGPWHGTPLHPFEEIQDGVDAAQDGDTVQVAAGTYLGRVEISNLKNFALVGAGAEVTIIDANPGVNPKAHVVSFNPHVHGEIRGFTITGSGDNPLFTAGVFTSQSFVTIEDNLILGNNDGITAASGSVVLVSHNRIVDNSGDHGVRFMTGSTGVVLNNLIADSGSYGVQMSDYCGDVIHNTIANHAIGIRCTPRPESPVTIRGNVISDSLVHGIRISGDETSAVPLVHISYNDVWNSGEADYYETYSPGDDSIQQPFEPQPGTGEIHVDPEFNDEPAGDYRLIDTSACIDAGPPAAEFTGSPCRDLDGLPRLLDGTGDGFSRPDLGAYELGADDGPGEVAGLMVPDLATLTWVLDAEFVIYNVYRAPLSALGYDAGFACRGSTTTTTFDILLDIPVPGDGFGYIVSGTSAEGLEGSLGFGSCFARSNGFDPCP